MTTLIDVLASAEFWMGVSLIATALPGPQTRLLPLILKTLARIVPQLLARLANPNKGV